MLSFSRSVITRSLNPQIEIADKKDAASSSEKEAASWLAWERGGDALKGACQAGRHARGDQEAGQDVSQIIFQRRHSVSPAVVLGRDSPRSVEETVWRHFSCENYRFSQNYYAIMHG